MTKINPPFRADHVGSYLRTAKIANSRVMFNKGLLDKSKLQAIEDEEIEQLVKNQISSGLKAVTDGEFRRAFWHLDFLEQLHGVQKFSADSWSIDFKDHKPKSLGIKITDKVGLNKDNSFFDAYLRLAKMVPNDICVKYTIPSPSMLYTMSVVRPDSYSLPTMYQNHEQLFNDIVQTWTDAMLKFYDLGLRYLQFDDTAFGELCSEEKRQEYAQKGFDPDKLCQTYVDIINRVLSKKPADMTISMHICRGNFKSTFFTEGSYEPIAKILFGSCNIDAFFLEYDSPRAGDFKPLRYINDQTVVLGLITSKFGELENKEEIINRIKEASKYVPLERLCLSTQCGFSSTEEGNLLSQDEQWNKIKLVVSIAKEIWKDF